MTNNPDYSSERKRLVLANHLDTHDISEREIEAITRQMQWFELDPEGKRYQLLNVVFIQAAEICGQFLANVLSNPAVWLALNYDLCALERLTDCEPDPELRKKFKADLNALKRTINLLRAKGLIPRGVNITLREIEDDTGGDTDDRVSLQLKP
jgi:hypothetical protein